MKKIVLGFLLLLFSFTFVACDDADTPTPTPTPSPTEEKIDYVEQLKLTSDYQGKNFMTDGIGIVTLANPVDGDTIHVYSSGTSGVVKIRFLGVNTPESTGRIEPWGHKASDFTKNIVNSAKTLVLEAMTIGTAPSADSTGTRYLAFVWYDMGDGKGFRNLNLELVANSLSKDTLSSAEKYGDTFLKCGTQASKENIRVWNDNDKDPDYYYGGNIITSLKELRTNPDEYFEKSIVVEGVISVLDGDNFYIQETIEDEETGEVETYGMYVFTQYHNYAIIKLGNRIRVIGKFTIFDTTGAYQITDVSYDEFFPNPNKHMSVISTGEDYVTTDFSAEKFNMEDSPYIEGTLVKIENIYVSEDPRNVYTSPSGAMTVVGISNGEEVQMRVGTAFAATLDPSYFLGKTFDVTSVVGQYEGVYQLMLNHGGNISFR